MGTFIQPSAIPITEPMVLTQNAVINGVIVGKSVVNEPDSTALGTDALSDDASGYENTALGAHTLASSTTGGANTAVGAYALPVSTTGDDNTAVGDSAGLNLTTGDDNTLVGQMAGKSITTGGENTVIGRGAQSGLTTGSRNIIIASGSGLATTSADGANDEFVLGDNTFKAANVAAQVAAASTHSLKIRIGTSTYYMLLTSVAP